MELNDTAIQHMSISEFAKFWSIAPKHNRHKPSILAMRMPIHREADTISNHVDGLQESWQESRKSYLGI